MASDKQELLLVWDLVMQLEKVSRFFWNRYSTAFIEMDLAEVERKRRMESDSRDEEDQCPF